jgi:hypothetical protein
MGTIMNFRRIGSVWDYIDRYNGKEILYQGKLYNIKFTIKGVTSLDGASTSVPFCVLTSSNEEIIELYLRDLEVIEDRDTREYHLIHIEDEVSETMFSGVKFGQKIYYIDKNGIQHIATATATIKENNGLNLFYKYNGSPYRQTNVYYSHYKVNNSFRFMEKE